MTTLKQAFSHESIQWRENISILLFTSVFIYLFQMLYNWSKTRIPGRKKINN